MAVRQPHVIWAQRESFLYITIEVDDVKIDELRADNSKLYFQGTSHSDKFATTMEFFDEIEGAELKRYGESTRFIEMTIPKKDMKWWPRLLKDKAKVHWLKVDFSKWVDEDESGAEDGMPAGGMGMPGMGGMGGDFDLNQYMAQMGGNMGGMNDFDGNLDDEDEDGDMPGLEDDADEEAEKKA